MKSSISAKPLLSILIPTKDRINYAFNSVKHVLSINDDRIEVVVQDNSSSKELEKLLNDNILDIRLVYNYSNENLSTIENFNRAVHNSSGEYLCAIGDDDGILPIIIDVVDWARKNNIDAIKPGIALHYYWPNSGVKNGPKNLDNGVLRVTEFDINAKYSNPKLELKKLLNEGGQNYHALELAKIYHGVVKREVMEKVKKRVGDYFGGLSPDIYSVVVISYEVEKLLCVDFPLTIPGICYKSTSAESLTGGHVGKLEDAPHFNGHTNYQWSKQMPHFYSVSTIWGDSCFAAVNDLKDEKLSSYFNIARSSARLLLKHPKYRKEVLEHYYKYSENTKVSKSVSIVKLFISLVHVFLKYSFLRLLRLVKKESKHHFIYDLNDISSAQIAADEFMDLQKEQVIKKLSDLGN